MACLSVFDLVMGLMLLHPNLVVNFACGMAGALGFFALVITLAVALGGPSPEAQAEMALREAIQRGGASHSQ